MGSAGMMNYEKKMAAIVLIAETLNPVPLRDLAFKLNGLAADKEQQQLEERIEETGSLPLI